MALLEAVHVDGHDYTFQQLRHLFEKAAAVCQEGVIESGDYKAVQRAAGANMSVDVPAGDAFVKMDTGVRNGLYQVTNDGVVNVAVTAADPANPRIDQLVLQANDSNVAGATDLAELKVLAGTPTVGATLDNRSGAAALGNDRILLADILVPAASTTVTTANIRDRRPWARGGHATKVRTTNLVPGTSAAVITETQARLETRGRPITVEFDASSTFSNGGGTTLTLSARVDGAIPAGADGGGTRVSATGPTDAVSASWRLTNVAAGSHLLAIYAHVNATSDLTQPMAVRYREDVGASAENA